MLLLKSWKEGYLDKACLLWDGKQGVDPVVDNTHGTHVERAAPSFSFENELSIHPTVHLKKYIFKAFLRAFMKSLPYNCVLVICRALKSLNVKSCTALSKILRAS